MYRLLDRVAPSQVPLAPYLQAIALTLQRAFDGDLEIETSLASGVSLPRERASLVGLILHEAITNARKYAFPDGRRGKARTEVRRVGNTLELLVSDDGVGFDPETVKQGVGTQLMHNLARQLNGSMHYGKALKGTELHLSFPA
jgi:two-component sensor histidine kinase